MKGVGHEAQRAHFPSADVAARGRSQELHLSLMGRFRVRYRISTTAGQSGSAVAFFGGESWDIVGIHSGESGDANAACRVTDRVVHAIREWMSYDAVEIAEEGCECDDVPA